MLQKLIVPPEQSGETLLAFLRACLSEFPSVKAIKRAIDAKKCKINGRVEYFSTHKVKAGDQIEIMLGEKKSIPKAQILFEDEDLIFYDKPPGKAVETFQDYFLVHRLDKDTSGVFLMAKTKEAQEKLIASFAAREVKKEYLVICDGKIAQKEGKIDNFLAKKVAYQGGVLVGSVPKEKGKRAITLFETLKTVETATLLLAKPITGRTHQIRVHFKEKGHPVLGDHQYGKTFRCKVDPPRQMLHAWKLAIPHPTLHETVSVTSPIPKDFLHVQKTLFGA